MPSPVGGKALSFGPEWEHHYLALIPPRFNFDPSEVSGLPI